MEGLRWKIVAAFLFVTVLKIAAVKGQLRCRDSYGSQRTLRVSDICNGVKNCRDGSDETYCASTLLAYCDKESFGCSNGICIPRKSFCDGRDNCGDNSDEFYCDIPSDFSCRPSWHKCANRLRCIPEKWICDGKNDCPDNSDEKNCVTPNEVEKNPKVIPAKKKLIEWFLNKRKNDSSTDKWGHELPRIVTALYLADESIFTPGKKEGEEMAYELTIQLLYKLSGNNTMGSQELALYIHALMVTCTDLKNFFGHNLVSELRFRVEKSNYTNPFAILALCNAGDTMTEKDVERVTVAFDSQHRPFWTDTQAIATMALQCILLHSQTRVDERTIKDMQQELKKRQFRNGTVDDPITTALVVQALLINETFKDYFDLDAAIDVLLENQDPNGSFGSVRNSYYVLPVLNYKNLLNVSTKHCKKSIDSEEESLRKLQDARGEKYVVQYSVWIGNDVDLTRTWRVKVLGNNTFYDVIETVRRLDSRHNVKYHVIDNKPYVSSLYGKEDDSEMGMYWFTYIKSLQTKVDSRLIEESPVDVNVQPNQELILWYKRGAWAENSAKAEL